MAAPPSPRPPRAQSHGGDAPVSLFLDTDLGTRIAMLVAPDTTVRHLKSQVAVEHAEAFPDMGPVTVNSIQLRLKGALYHLSQSMTVASAFNGVKGRCFLHVKMEQTAVAIRSRQGTLEIAARRTSEDRIATHVEKHVRELPAVTPEVAIDGLTHGLGDSFEGGDATGMLNNVHAHDAVPDDALLPPSSVDTETKNETQGPASDAYVNELSKQTNISHAVDTDAKEDVLRDRDCDVDGSKQVRVEGIMGQANAVDDISHRKKRKKAKKNDAVHMPAADPRITNESDTMDVNKSIRDPLETNPTHGKHSNTSFGQEVNGNIPEDSLRIETQSTVRKKKKKKTCQSAPSEAGSAMETTKLMTGAVGLSKPGTDAYEVNLTNKDGSKAISSVLLLSSELNDGSQGGKHDQFVNNVQESTDLTSEQGNFDHVHNANRNPYIGDTINSTAEVPPGGEMVAEGNNGRWDGGEKHEEAKLDECNEGGHNGDVAKTSNIDKDGKDIDALEDRPTNYNISKVKKRKKVKKISSVDISSMDTAVNKEIPEHTENAEKSKKDYTEGEKHEEAKTEIYNEGNHNGDVAKASNMDKDGKDIDALEERPTNHNISKEKKRKKVKKISSVDMSSMDTAVNKEIPEHAENTGKSDKDYTEREILHGPYVEPLPDNVQHGNSNVIDNPNGDGKRKKKRRRTSESLKATDPNHDQTKSSEHVNNSHLIHHTNSAPVDAKQTTQGGVEKATGSDSNKFGESLHIAATTMIDEVLADLKSGDRLSKELSKDLLTEQIHLDSNTSALELPASTGNKVGNYATLPLKDPEAAVSDALARSPSHKKPKGKQLNPSMIDSSHHSFVIPEEDADANLKDSDTLKFAGKASDLKDVFTGDVAEQKDNDKAKSTKRQRKKVKKIPTDKTTQSLDEQVNQVVGAMEGVNASIHEDFVEGGSVIETPMKTVAIVQQKGEGTSKTRVSKIQEANLSTHTAKDSQDENPIGITGTHDNENAIGTTGIHDNENASGYPTELPVVQKDSATLKSSSPNVRKERKKRLKTELKSRDSAMQHVPSADLVHCSAEKDLVSPKNSADAGAHPATDKINFIDHFFMDKINDQSVSVESIQNNEQENMEEKNRNGNTGSTEPNDLPESLLPAEKTSLTDDFGTSEVVVPSAKAENMNGEYDKVKSGKEKRKKKRKNNSEGPDVDTDNLGGDHQGTIIGTQNSLSSVVQNGRVGQDNRNEDSIKVTQDVSTMQLEPENAVFDTNVEKELNRHDNDSQNNLLINKDNAKISKELWKSISQQKSPVSNLVKSFAMSPTASSDSTEGTPTNRFRLAVRKVPKKRHQQANGISKVEKAALQSLSNNSSASANSGISTTANDESDDDGALSLSQKSLRSLQIGSILRGCSSYKKAKQKQAELLDDDTEVPDSQPVEDLWG